jgi:hypothetical protein
MDIEGRYEALRKSQPPQDVLLLDTFEGLMVVKPTGTSLGDGPVLRPGESDYELGRHAKPAPSPGSGKPDNAWVWEPTSPGSRDATKKERPFSPGQAAPKPPKMGGRGEGPGAGITDESP